jgi:hypothetical protein
MARKSVISIEMEMYVGLQVYIESLVSGGFYPRDCRPLDSHSEDAVLTVSNSTADQIQEGRARLNIFVPDLDNGSGRRVPNITRLEELSAKDAVVIEKLNKIESDYEFSLFQATDIIAVPDVDEHFVNINIQFKRVTFN